MFYKKEIYLFSDCFTTPNCKGENAVKQWSVTWPDIRDLRIFDLKPKFKKFKEITKVSTKFYIKDDNGIFLSADGKTKYICLEGSALYDFLNSEDGKNRTFYVDINENGDKIGIETKPKMVTACNEQRERDR